MVLWFWATNYCTIHDRKSSPRKVYDTRYALSENHTIQVYILYNETGSEKVPAVAQICSSRVCVGAR